MTATPTPGAGISADDIASVMEAQEEMMPELVTVFTRVEVRDSRGGVTVTWPGPGVVIIGRIGTVRDSVMTAFSGQLRGKATSVLTVPVGSPLQQQDRVSVLGGMYVVVADMSRSSYATAARFLIEEV